MHVAYNGKFPKRKGVGKAHLIFFYLRVFVYSYKVPK